MGIITISSSSYSGYVANILFTPSDNSIVINLGNQTLPYVFNSSILTPPREIYGVYTILIEGSDCPSIMTVPNPTPTPTPTITTTRTPTPTPTITPTPTTSPNPCLITPTPSNN